MVVGEPQLRLELTLPQDMDPTTHYSHLSLGSQPWLLVSICLVSSSNQFLLLCISQSFSSFPEWPLVAALCPSAHSVDLPSSNPSFAVIPCPPINRLLLSGTLVLSLIAPGLGDPLLEPEPQVPSIGDGMASAQPPEKVLESMTQSGLRNQLGAKKGLTQI